MMGAIVTMDQFKGDVKIWESETKTKNMADKKTQAGQRKVESMLLDL